MRKAAGFSLFELLITLVILGILFSIAYPTYTYYTTKARRTDAKVALLDVASRLQQYYLLNNHSFEGATLQDLGTKATSPEGFYALSLSNLSTTTYTLSAKPLGSQAIHDTKCGTFTLDQLANKGITGTGTIQDCW